MKLLSDNLHCQYLIYKNVMILILTKTEYEILNVYIYMLKTLSYIGNFNYPT